MTAGRSCKSLCFLRCWKGTKSISIASPISAKCDSLILAVAPVTAHGSLPHVLQPPVSPGSGSVPSVYAACRMLKAVSSGLLQKKPPDLVSCCHSSFTACSSPSCAPVLQQVQRWLLPVCPAPWCCPTMGIAMSMWGPDRCQWPSATLETWMLAFCCLLQARGRQRLGWIGLPCAPGGSQQPAPIPFSHRQAIYGRCASISMPGTRMLTPLSPFCCDDSCV